MKYLALLFVLLIACEDVTNIYNIDPTPPVVKKDVTVVTYNQYVYAEEVTIHTDELVISQSVLPVTFEAEIGETLYADFEVDVSNFGSHYPKCNCINVGGYLHDCSQIFVVVDSVDTFEVAGGL